MPRESHRWSSSRRGSLLLCSAVFAGLVAVACSEARPAPSRLRRLVARDLEPMFGALFDDHLPLADTLPESTRGLGFDTTTGVQLIDEALVSSLLDAALDAVDRTWERDRASWLRARLVSGERARSGVNGPLRVRPQGRAVLAFASPVPAGSELVVWARAVLVPMLPPGPGSVAQAPKPVMQVSRESGVVATLALPEDGRPVSWRVALDAPTERLTVTCTVPPVDGAVEVEGAECELDELLALAAAGVLPSSPVLRSCDPAAGGEPCVREIIGEFARRAWRRPATTEEHAGLAAAVRELGDPELGLRTVLAAMAVSPHALFLNAGATDEPGRALAMAAAVSQLLVQEAPDAPLSSAAAAGLLGPDALRAQVGRLLDSPRAERFVAAFVSQWLGLAALPRLQRASTLPLAVRDAMADEATALLLDALRSGRRMSTLLDADATFADEVLAAHYALPESESGPGFLRRSLLGTPRAGLVTLGGALAANAHSSWPGIAVRGQWLLTRFLCAPAPSPPVNVPEGAPNESMATLKELADQHLANPDCRACHAALDPIGLVLAGFGPNAQLLPAGFVGEIEGTWSDGSTFRTAAELAHLVARDPRFGPCLARQMFRFVVGREVSAADEPAIEALAAKFEASGQSLRDLVVETFATTAFREAVELSGGAP
jgi:hypothetical protein